MIIGELKKEIKKGDYSCVVYQDEVIFAHNKNGVKPIVDFWFNGDLKGATVVDKVIGRAAAMFMADAGVKRAHGILLSQTALDVLKANGIETTFDRLVPKIYNRTGDDMCPMERSVIDTDDVKVGTDIILTKLRNMNIL